MPGSTDWSILLHPDFVTVYDMLYQWYTIEKLSIGAVANRLGVNSVPVRRKLVELGIPLKAKGKPSPNNFRKEVKQKPNRPKDSAAEMAMKKEAERLGMRPDDYVPVETRKSEKRDCSRFESCLLYCAILHGWLVPCANCNGQPEFFESMVRTNQVFEEQFGRSLPEIATRKPGVEKVEKEEPHQFYKYLEGVYFYKEKTK